MSKIKSMQKIVKFRYSTVFLFGYSIEGSYDTMVFECPKKAIVAQVSDEAPWAFCYVIILYLKLVSYGIMKLNTNILMYLSCRLVLCIKSLNQQANTFL